MKIILIYLFNGAKYKAGKYQMASTLANTFCKFVKQFSFTVITVSSGAALPDIKHQGIALLFNTIEGIPSMSASLRYHRMVLYENLTTGYYLAHSSKGALKLLISFRLSLSKPQSIM
ncbi:hypothetical protein [Enterobacter huaxiensis]|jgi:hypothetical protein|uniref:Uncharacterized protein n=1 Tax=Enterobacter huaxiensis TaxID=2494702 RepID=A0A428LZ52_9ENTR|nr:hypothetical protein [Enterobacter huaxiensis]MCS5449385.1 hypothetical protein [Enterobacter huaxiensis]MEB7541137.1 hypothetical protein [Enterobacter huaxiensis]MEB7580032.1 hypothetical protein [Enterobacter huaxiensis]MEB7661770.1 hypothetical protein [Enterobacter huaxiensis]RSK70672.1 hypothetical protein EJE24_02570 [Enterobacter huaxiensis]